MAHHRLRILVKGLVQGIGFRPHVYRLACGEGLSGWVKNGPEGVAIEVEGESARLDTFLRRLREQAPPLSRIDELIHEEIPPQSGEGFRIVSSETRGGKTALISPDIAVCGECLREMFDPANRRYLYPFINCTHCGPRFTIIDALPYDRVNTAMRGFTMCEACAAEYATPADRRFHAQPNACPQCGPHASLWNADGAVIAERHEAVLRAVERLRAGGIVALKGLGGFHLLVDARDEDAVMTLRLRKRREEKPLAVMAPDLAAVRRWCETSSLEESLLFSPESPIVLLHKRDGSELAPSIAPRNPRLGVMLPYTPLHHVLLRELNAPLVATSGNLTDEPICIGEREALQRLRGIADVFLVHDRPIRRYVDDSVVRVIDGEPRVLRRARGYAPLPLPLSGGEPSVIAFGAHLKNTIAVGRSDGAFLSQHVGDLETPAARASFQEIARALPAMLEAEPKAAVCDLHPDYWSARYAESAGLTLMRVQHHYAHAAACMAEHELDEPVLAVSWDGSGYSPDGTVWGGEFLICDWEGFTRVGWMRPFPLPGGERAVREPRRAALGLLFEMAGESAFDRATPAVRSAFTPGESKALLSMLARGLNSPMTSSAGRLFDAAAALIGLRQRLSFEGQAAMELEWSIGSLSDSSHYPIEFRPAGAEPKRLTDGSPISGSPMREAWTLDWAPMFDALMDDVRRGMSVAQIAARFHNTLCEAIAAAARRVGIANVALTGGCFQNAYLCETSAGRLRDEGFTPRLARRAPSNDGGVAYGQLALAARGSIQHVSRHPR
ncbi:MAG: carbamoyltransferase HypF [bacterium]|nr:carbamoyltransferase HypF [bacterium]